MFIVVIALNIVICLIYCNNETGFVPQILHSLISIKRNRRIHSAAGKLVFSIITTYYSR